MELSAGLILYRIQRLPELLLLNDTLNSNKRHWSPPKGRVIGKEDELKCAIRETIDITGLSVKDIIVEEDFRAEIKYLAGNSRPKRVVFFLAQVSQHGRIIPPGFAGLHFAWLPLQQAQDKAMFKSMQDVLKQAYQFIEERRVKPIRKQPTTSQLTESINRRVPTTANLEISSRRSASDERFDYDNATSWKKSTVKEQVVEKDKYEQTEGVKEQQVQLQSGENGNENPLYKTRLCERFETEGFCPYGPRCTFAHGNDELRDRPTFGGEAEKKEGPENMLYKTRLCERFMKENFCQYGPRCNFAHSVNELRNRPVITKDQQQEDLSSEFPEPRRPLSAQQTPSLQHSRDKSWSKQPPQNNGVQSLRNDNWEKKPFVEIKPTKKGESITIQGLQIGREKSISRSVSPDNALEKEKNGQKTKKETVVSLQELMSGNESKRRIEIIDRPIEDLKGLAKKSAAEKAQQLEDKLSKDLSKFFFNEDSSPTVNEQIKEITRMEIRNDLSKQQLFNILVSTLFAEYNTEKLKSRLSLLKQFIKSQTDQLALTRAFEKHLTRHTTNAAQTAVMFKDLYDLEFVEEDVLLEWYDDVPVDKSEVRRKVRPLVEWLRTAEEEDD